MDVFQPHGNVSQAGDARGCTEPMKGNEAIATEGMVTKRRSKLKDKLGDVCDTKQEELYNKTLQESGIDIAGMEWEEKKELAEVLLLSKDEPHATGRAVEHGEDPTEDVGGRKCGPALIKSDTLASDKSSVILDDHPDQRTATITAMRKVRKRPFVQTAGGDKITVCVDVHAGGDWQEEPIKKERRLRQSRRQKENVKERVLPARKKRIKAEVARTRSGDICQGETVDDIIMERSSGEPADSEQATSTAILQEPHSDLHSDAQTSSIRTDNLGDRSSVDPSTGDATSSATGHSDTFEQRGVEVDKKGSAVFSYIDLDDDETQPPDSPDLFRDKSAQVPIVCVPSSTSCEQDEDPFEMESTDDEAAVTVTSRKDEVLAKSDQDGRSSHKDETLGNSNHDGHSSLKDEVSLKSGQDGRSGRKSEICVKSGTVESLGCKDEVSVKLDQDGSLSRKDEVSVASVQDECLGRMETDECVPYTRSDSAQLAVHMTSTREHPEKNTTSQEPSVTDQASQGFDTSQGEDKENEEESQSPTFKKKLLGMEKIQEVPDKKLLRKYRKYKEKMRLSAPLFSPSPQDPVMYAKVILQLFDLYIRKVRSAQSVIVGHVDWGTPVPVGRHMSRTLDIKRRGQPSFSWSDDSESQPQDDVESRKQFSQKQADIENDDLVESLPDIPSIEPGPGDSYLNREPTEYVPLEATLQSEERVSQTLCDEDDDFYNADTEEACNSVDGGFRSLRNAATATATVTTANVDNNLVMNASQSSNSLLNSQGEIKPYQKQPSQEADLAEVDDVVDVVSDSESSESSSSMSVKKWTTLGRVPSRDLVMNEKKSGTTPRDRNSEVEIEWKFDSLSQQMKKVLFKTNSNQTSSQRSGDDPTKTIGDHVDIGADHDSSDDDVSGKGSTKRPSAQATRRSNRPDESPQRVADSGNRDSSSSESEYPVTKRSWKKLSRKSFMVDNSDNSIHLLQTEPLPQSTAPFNTAGNTAPNTLTSSVSPPAVVHIEDDDHETKNTPEEAVSHVACPLCNEFFNSSQIELHASECDGPVIHQTRKRKHQHSGQMNDLDEDGEFRDIHAAVDVHRNPGERSHSEDKRTDAHTSAEERRRRDDWTRDDIDMSAVRKKAAQMKQSRPMEVCMICSEDIPSGLEYEQHVDRCIQAAIEKNKGGAGDDEDRRPRRARTKGGLVSELESTWDQGDRTGQ
ncbi:uncharacterized protein LOC121384066 isoform X2 [Gigantopelta aegis]|uniref:uncharacterized protein LOC121384066 isoform X2 n=1 Tax=Gigantopelta aegis TaxID=1735272 RepID=UPI001B8895FC|nr:uncharacterized protein LOC121384066 isoform X2 [Gigantopelta aegis]